MKNKKEVLERLKNDEDYYGDFGKKFISNSDIRTLMTNPLGFKEPSSSSSSLSYWWLLSHCNTRA